MEVLYCILWLSPQPLSSIRKSPSSLPVLDGSILFSLASNRRHPLPPLTTYLCSALLNTHTNPTQPNPHTHTPRAPTLPSPNSVSSPPHLLTSPPHLTTSSPPHRNLPPCTIEAQPQAPSPSNPSQGSQGSQGSHNHPSTSPWLGSDLPSTHHHPPWLSTSTSCTRQDPPAPAPHQGRGSCRPSTTSA